MIKIILSGCMGKMGRVIMNLVEQNPNFTIVAGCDKMAPAAEDFPFPVYSELTKCTEEADVVVDFSRPDALPKILRFAQQKNMPIVLASTGYNANDISSIEYASENIPIMCSSNYSLGINLLKQLSTTATTILSSNFDIEIEERHHNAKVDAPSGTAMMLADAVNKAAGGDLEYVYDRHENRNPRGKRELGLHALRGGSITGEHSVIFAGPDEVVELRHVAYSRNIFALGALRATEFICSLPCGLYDMSSLLTQQQIITGAYSSESDAIISISNIKSPATINNIFKAIKDADIMLDIISQPIPVNNVYTLSISVSKPLADKAYKIILGVSNGATVEVLDDIAKVTVEGSGMAHHAGVSGDVFAALSNAQVPVLLITTSETKITCCIPKEYTQTALNVLKELLH
ncbi:MAG: 4-hydroxy-tetrahydrodipicolinate reductase [Clostridia bacterium]|nr:4-hydroxy-tetrahydrodipicolinate reductase [Clostridia bacterium]